MCGGSSAVGSLVRRSQQHHDEKDCGNHDRADHGNQHRLQSGELLFCFFGRGGLRLLRRVLRLPGCRNRLLRCIHRPLRCIHRLLCSVLRLLRLPTGRLCRRRTGNRLPFRHLRKDRLGPFKIVGDDQEPAAVYVFLLIVFVIDLVIEQKLRPVNIIRVRIAAEKPVKPVPDDFRRFRRFRLRLRFGGRRTLCQ